MTDFQLTPAEAALLLKPRRASATSCVQCALLALVAKGHLSIEAKSGLFDRARLVRGNGDGAPLPDHHRVIKEAVLEAGRDSTSSTEVSASLRATFGTDHGGYVHDHVAPLLIERGLLHRSNRKWLGLISYIHYEPTAEGRRRAQQIGGLLDELAQMKSLVRSDPHRARRLLEAAGVLVILSPQARAQAKKLRQLIGERGDGGPVFTDNGGGGDWQVGVDAGNLGSAADCMSLLDGVSCAADFTTGDGGDGGDGGGGGD